MQQNSSSDDIVYKRVEIVEPGGVGPTRVTGMEGKLYLEPLSQQVRGRLTVPGATGCDPVEVNFLLDSDSRVTVISEESVANMQRERPGIELIFNTYNANISSTMRGNQFIQQSLFKLRVLVSMQLADLWEEERSGVVKRGVAKSDEAFTEKNHTLSALQVGFPAPSYQQSRTVKH